MPSEAFDALVTMLSGVRVTPELSNTDARTGWDGMELILPHAPGVTIDDTTVAGRPARWVTPESAGSTTILHLHGGGYVIGSAKSHTPFATHLAATVGARVLLLDYRLAPEHPAPAAIDDAAAAYAELLASGIEPGDIVFSGDSAGGGLAIATIARLRDTLVPLPGAVVLLSPWTDATGDYESMRTKVDEEVILSPELLAHWGGMYAGDLPADDPRVSPCLCGLQGLPRVHIQVGTRELLLDDARRLADKLTSASVDVDLVVCDGLIHIWPVLGAGIVPEAQEALDRIAAFLRG
jgi:monoterpene epsilon-lactone hydrolase